MKDDNEFLILKSNTDDVTYNISIIFYNYDLHINIPINNLKIDKSNITVNDHRIIIPDQSLLNLYPFLNILPENSPYLLYEQNNSYYVKYIITDSFKRDLLGNLYNLHLKMRVILLKKRKFVYYITHCQVFCT